MNWITVYRRVNTVTGESEMLPFTPSHADEIHGDFHCGVRREDALELVNKWNRQASNPLARVRWQYWI